jgi:hypothetical protein
MRSFFKVAALVAHLTPRICAEFETSYHSSSLAIQPFTIVERSSSYDPENTALFLTCPAGSAVAQQGPTIYDSHGELVWADPTIGVCGDLNLQTYDGQDYLTMWIGTGDAGTGLQTGSGVGIMLNSKYEIVQNVSAVNPGRTDLHEFNIARGNKTALVTAYNPIPVSVVPEFQAAHCVYADGTAGPDIRGRSEGRVVPEFANPRDRHRYRRRTVQLVLDRPHRSV